MNRNEIEQKVIDYINDEEIRYALLINGAWGSGKTYLYNNYLADAIAKVECGKKERKVNVYISLYGISNIESLAKELITNYILKVKRINKKMYEISSGIASIISKCISISTDSASINFNGILGSFRNCINIKDMVICFDDLERCSIPINDLFGFINNLVEHCYCKVIILADEDNIGKMYANMNLEIKYLTLLSGKKLIKGVNEKGEIVRNNTDEELTIEQLKKKNEEIYSENYIYKDIKEKVIGLSLNYEPELETEIENIIKMTLKNQHLKQELISKKEDILNYMSSCENRNIRIIQIWLVKFEEIYKVIKKNYATSKHYDEIFKRFMVYSIRVACAVGKNKKLMKWSEEAEYANVRLDDAVLFESEGYRFIDDQYIKSEVDEVRICKAANYIDDRCNQDERKEQENEKRYSTGEMLGRLEQWYLYEDSEISDMIGMLKEEIEEEKYVPQNYQNIIRLLVLLNSIGLCHSELCEISNILMEKIKEYSESIEIENFEYDFQDKELSQKFHKYYDPIYDYTIQSNRIYNEIEINIYLKDNDPDGFIKYCQDNHNLFLQKRSFTSYIDIDEFICFFQACSLPDIYRIIRAFQGVYNFRNLSDFYKNDAEKLEELKNRINEIPWDGVTRNRAKDMVISVLSEIIDRIANKNANNRNDGLVYVNPKEK